MRRRKRAADVYKRIWGYTKYFWLAAIVADLGVQASQASYSTTAMQRRQELTELWFTVAFDVEIMFRFISFVLDNDWRDFLSHKETLPI